MAGTISNTTVVTPVNLTSLPADCETQYHRFKSFCRANGVYNTPTIATFDKQQVEGMADHYHLVYQKPGDQFGIDLTLQAQNPLNSDADLGYLKAFYGIEGDNNPSWLTLYPPESKPINPADVEKGE